MTFQKKYECIAKQCVRVGWDEVDKRTGLEVEDCLQETSANITLLPGFYESLLCSATLRFTSHALQSQVGIHDHVCPLRAGHCMSLQSRTPRMASWVAHEIFACCAGLLVPNSAVLPASRPIVLISLLFL